jgi:hypothetical protein
METIQTLTNFRQFLFHNKRNRITLYLAAAAIIIQFAIFKYLYPFASYIHGDSFSYLEAARQNLTINTYMIGYSKFLRVFNTFAKPDYLLAAFQYLLIQCSVLFLLFTIFYFYRPGRYMQIILLSTMVFNPLFLHLGNMVSSDGLFLALSCIWFTLLLWLIQKPSNKIIIWHAVVLCIVFTFRYNALIYPIVALLAFWLSRLPLKKKIAGLGLAFLLCGCFVGFTMWRYKVLTGYWQYSPFSGWQLANNAMYIYREVAKKDRKRVPDKFQALDKMITKFYDHNRNVFVGEASTAYMWSPALPLMKYRDSLFKKAKDTAAIELKKWASMGPLYKNYGLQIIKKYPLHFLRYFIWPNARKYYAPPIEFLEVYNSGNNHVSPEAKTWFGYKSTKVNVRMKTANVRVLDYYPFLSGIINLFMLFGLLYYCLLKGWQYNQVFSSMILMAGFVWLLNAGFTIFASSAALRFQSFPIILTTLFTLLLIDWMVQLMRQLKQEQKKQVLNNPIATEVIA